MNPVVFARIAWKYARRALLSTELPFASFVLSTKAITARTVTDVCLRRMLIARAVITAPTVQILSVKTVTAAANAAIYVRNVVCAKTVLTEFVRTATIAANVQRFVTNAIHVRTVRRFARMEIIAANVLSFAKIAILANIVPKSFAKTVMAAANAVRFVIIATSAKTAPIIFV